MARADPKRASAYFFPAVITALQFLRYTLEKGGSEVCARYGQSPNQTKKQEETSENSDQPLAGRITGGKGVSFLEDDDLDAGEELPINAPQQTKPPNAKLGSTPQLSSPMGSPPSLRPPACMLLFSSLIFPFAMMRLPVCCLCTLGICACSSAWPSPHHNVQLPNPDPKMMKRRTGIRQQD